MPTYKYVAISPSGEKLQGKVGAQNQAEAAAQVKRMTGGYLQKLTVAGGVDLTITEPKFKEKALTMCCSQMSILLRAGLPLSRALETVTQQCEDKVLMEVFRKTTEDVSAGAGLADSLAAHGPKLPVALIETIRAGESAGTLDESFKKMETYFSKSYKLKGKVKSAMTYPVMLIIVAVIVVMIVVNVALPAFLPMFEGRDLPAPTALLLTLYNFMGAYWYIPLGVLVLLGILFKVYRDSPDGRTALSGFAMRMPILGKVNTMNAASQFANTMATLLSAGLPMVRALEITGKVVTNLVTGRSVDQAVERVSNGQRLGQALEDNPYLPPLLVEMTAVGEESGSLEETLSTIGRFYDEEAETATAAALAKLEPLITVCMGVVVGFILISLYLPMFTMFDSF